MVSQLLSDAKSGTISESVDAVSGATYSSYAILSAYRDALSKAGASSAGDTDTAPTSSGTGSSKTAHAAAHGISSKTRFADGTYTGYAECAEEDTFDYYLALDVTVKGGKVTNISNVRGSATGNKGDKRKAPYSASDNDSYLKKAAAGVTPQLLSDAKSGIVSKNIDTVSGATYSSQSILSAYYDALEKAAAAAGSKEKAAAAGKKPAVSGIGGSSGASSASPATIAIDSAPATYADGTYTAYAFCEDTGNASAFGAYYLGVTISVKGGNVAVEKIFGDEEGVVDPSYVYDAGENLRYLNRAINGYGISGKHPGLLKQITDQIAAGTVAGSYDTISGATYSSKSIIEAYAKALDAAKQSAAESYDGAGGDLQDRDAPDSDGSDASDSVGRA